MLNVTLNMNNANLLFGRNFGYSEWSKYTMADANLLKMLAKLY